MKEIWEGRGDEYFYSREFPENFEERNPKFETENEESRVFLNLIQIFNFWYGLSL